MRLITVPLVLSVLVALLLHQLLARDALRLAAEADTVDDLYMMYPSLVKKYQSSGRFALFPFHLHNGTVLRVVGTVEPSALLDALRASRMDRLVEALRTTDGRALFVLEYSAFAQLQLGNLQQLSLYAPVTLAGNPFSLAAVGCASTDAPCLAAFLDAQRPFYSLLHLRQYTNSSALSDASRETFSVESSRADLQYFESADSFSLTVEGVLSLRLAKLAPGIWETARELLARTLRPDALVRESLIGPLGISPQHERNPALAERIAHVPRNQHPPRPITRALDTLTLLTEQHRSLDFAPNHFQVLRGVRMVLNCPWNAK